MKVPFYFTSALFVALGFGLVALNSCGTLATEVAFDPENPPETLSDYGFFADLPTQTPNDRVVPYDLITPLFTDYAYKARFIYVPEGKQIAYNDTAVLDFPEGSAIIKTFYYPTDFRKPAGERRLLETRVLLKSAKGWEALPYLWNDAQTEATLHITGQTIPVEWVHNDGQTRKINYQVPDKNQCKGCHIYGRNTVLPIGPKARNLNHTFTYADGPANQLSKWAALGILTGAPKPDAAPRVAQWDDPASGNLDARARAYLDVNCAHCHNPEGPASTTGFNLSYMNEDLANLGLCKHPVAAAHASGKARYDILPGSAEGSVVYVRMLSTDPGAMMPEVGRTIVHEEGVALVRDWINSLDGTCENGL